VSGRLTLVVFLSVFGLFVLPAGASPAACPSCGHNLIVNPGAESGKGAEGDEVVPVPGWTGTHGFTAGRYAWGGSDVDATSPGAPNRGKNYFYGGPASAVSTGTQSITLSGAAGHNAKLTGWLGGYSSQGDAATLTVTFLGSGGQTLGTLSIGPVTVAQRANTSKFLLRTASTTVPPGTTSAKLVLRMTRAAGSDNDGLADNLSLVLS
jgi:hypothetical protein